MAKLDTILTPIRPLASRASDGAKTALAAGFLATAVPAVCILTRWAQRREEPRSLLLYADLLADKATATRSWEKQLSDGLRTYDQQFGDVAARLQDGEPLSHILNISLFSSKLIRTEVTNNSLTATVIDTARTVDPDVLTRRCAHPNVHVRIAAIDNPACPEHAAVVAALSGWRGR